AVPGDRPRAHPAGRASDGARPAPVLPHWCRSWHPARRDGRAPRRPQSLAPRERSEPMRGLALRALPRQRADATPVQTRRLPARAHALRDAAAERPAGEPEPRSHGTTGHGSAMLAWGLPSGRSGAWDNTLIPEG